MSKIIPFPALLPKPELAAKVVCPPYDVLTSDEARGLAAGNEYSLLHVTKPEIDFSPEVGEYDDRVYIRGRDNLKAFEDKGWLTRDAASFYIYRIEHRGHAQTGLVCAAAADDYDSDRIKKHEKTRKEKEDDRARVADTLSAHAEPVLFACRTSPAVKKAIAVSTSGEPLYDVMGPDGARHILWRAVNQDELAKVFGALDAVYIADGHHRSAVGSRTRALRKAKNPNHTGEEPYNFFPVVIFPDDELRVYRYDWDGKPDDRPLAEVTIADIMKIADEGGIMPPKSTWFSPKLISGLFVYTF